MGKANKQKAKKLAKKRAKTRLKARDEDAMVIDDESAPAAPLTGRQKHAQKVAAKRALRAAKQAKAFGALPPNCSLEVREADILHTPLDGRTVVYVGTAQPLVSAVQKSP